MEYQVILNPLIGPDKYGREMNITDYIDWENGGIGEISRTLGSNYDVGRYTFNHIELSLKNETGIFNTPEDDPRSFFTYTRDRSKITVVFIDDSGNRSVSFVGIINDEGSSLDFSTGLLSLYVLSLDSVFKAIISPGSLAGGMMISEIINQLLTAVSVSVDGIEVGLDLPIDNGGAFTNTTVKNALDELLLVSNSVIIPDGEIVHVRPRNNNDEPVMEFLLNDLREHDNIITIENYNSGLNRVFNYITVNSITSHDTKSFVEKYGKRHKSLVVTSITDPESLFKIADNVKHYYKRPHVEFDLITRTDIAKQIQIQDSATVNVRPVLSLASGKTLPFYKIVKYGEFKYPQSTGALSFSKSCRVIGIVEDPPTFTTTLKMRDL
jgi:hypothetical protein